MRADLLHVVATVANPIRWESRIRLAKQFMTHMLDSGVKLTMVEVAHGDRPYALDGVSHVTHVPLRQKTLVWAKESAINIGISRLPQDWKYVAWIDADISFRKPAWAAETVHALQQYDVVQPWSDCYDLGPNDDHIETHRSFCRMYHERKPVSASGVSNYPFAHPGYGWAATRQALEHVGGLLDTGALGASDHAMALALIGKANQSYPATVTDGYKRPILQWQERAERHIARNIGYVPGTIEHHWHGPKEGRAYVSRWDILVRHAFDPSVDIKRNVFGLPELAGNKPELRHDLDTYHRNRVEDSNTFR